MRLIGHLAGESSAQTFGDYLYVLGIDNQIDFEKDTGWAVWIHDEDRIQEAMQLLETYRTNPADPKYAAKARDAGQLRAAKQKDDAAYRKRMITPDRVFRPVAGYGGYRIGPLTAGLIMASAGVFLLSRLGREPQHVSALFMTDYLNSGLVEIRSGQVWRLFTPVLVHFGVLHILFNMMWLHDLGSMIEARQGSLRLALLVLVIAGFSNLGQYLVSGPVFGGMSGVIYGLLGYVWMRGKFDPASGLMLHQSTVIMMLIWFFACLVGVIPGVANTTHTVGLVMGMAWGYLSSLRRQ